MVTMNVDSEEEDNATVVKSQVDSELRHQRFTKFSKFLSNFMPMLFAREEDEEEDEDVIQPKESGDFPNLFQHLPRFHVVGVDHRNPEPVVLGPYLPRFKNRWLLVISMPPLDFPFSSRSIREIYKRADKFSELSCEVFFLTIDFWSKLKTFRNTLERMDEEELRQTRLRNKLDPTQHEEPDVPRDPKNIHFISDPKARISGPKYFNVFCEVPAVEGETGKSGKSKKKEGNPKAGKMNYPGYFLLTPDKELVQTVVIRNSDQLFVKKGGLFFGYPVTEAVADAIVDNVATHKPIHEAVKRLRESGYKETTFGTFMDDMIRREKSEGEKKESLFKWKGWAKAAEGVLLGGPK